MLPYLQHTAVESVEYESEQSASTSDLVGPFQVASAKVGTVTKTVETGEGEDLLIWKVTRSAGLVSVEVADADGHVLTISQTVDGIPIGVQVPGLKAILTCNPSQSDFTLDVDPTAYGESMTLFRLHP